MVTYHFNRCYSLTKGQQPLFEADCHPSVHYSEKILESDCHRTGHGNLKQGLQHREPVRCIFSDTEALKDHNIDVRVKLIQQEKTCKHCDGVSVFLYVCVCCQTWLQLVNEPIGLVCADECCGWTDRKKGERDRNTKVTVAMHWGGFLQWFYVVDCCASSLLATVTSELPAVT